jgi:uncharacterized protein (DUF433 family)
MERTGCPIVEQVPGKAGGEPVVKGTRILADVIVQEFDSGSPIEENYPKLTEETIRALVAFAHSRKPQPQLRAKSWWMKIYPTT